MFITNDPILVSIVVIGVFAYYAIKALFSAPQKKEDVPVSELFRRIREEKEQMKEELRYQKWLEDHLNK